MEGLTPELQAEMFKDAKSFMKKPIPIKAIQQDKEFSIVTLEGTMIGSAGDYLVEGVEKELYPVKKEIFEKTYEEVKKDA